MKGTIFISSQLGEGTPAIMEDHLHNVGIIKMLERLFGSFISKIAIEK